MLSKQVYKNQEKYKNGKINLVVICRQLRRVMITLHLIQFHNHQVNVNRNLQDQNQVIQSIIYRKECLKI